MGGFSHHQAFGGQMWYTFDIGKHCLPNYETSVLFTCFIVWLFLFGCLATSSKGKFTSGL